MARLLVTCEDGTLKFQVPEFGNPGKSSPGQVSTTSVEPVRNRLFQRGLFVYAFTSLAILLLGTNNAICQTIRADPPCGKPGDTIKIYGYGWHPGAGVICTCNIFFSGQLVQTQTSWFLAGCDGQTFQIPLDATAGDHDVAVDYISGVAVHDCVYVKVEVNPDGCGGTPFKAGAPANPEDPAPHPYDPNGTHVDHEIGLDRLRYQFDPSQEHSLPDCAHFTTIQVVTISGVPAEGGAPVNLRPTQLDPDNPQMQILDKIAYRDPATGKYYFNDFPPGADEPYSEPYTDYEHAPRGPQDLKGTGRGGVKYYPGTSKSPEYEALFGDDKPSLEDVGYSAYDKAGYSEIHLSGENCVICTEGVGAGLYYGKILWEYVGNDAGLSSSGKFNPPTTNRGQPSENFKRALDRAILQHFASKGFTLPTHPGKPSEGGDCTCP